MEPITTPAAAPAVAELPAPTVLPEAPPTAQEAKVLASLTQAIQLAYLHPWKLAGRAFIQGFWNAVGMAVGYTVLFSLLAVIFQALGGYQLLAKPLENLQQSVIQSQLRAATSGAGSFFGAEASPTPKAGSGFSTDQLQELLKQYQQQKTQL